MVVTNKANLGFAGETSRGILLGQWGAEHILTLNNDTWVDRYFVEHLVKPT